MSRGMMVPSESGWEANSFVGEEANTAGRTMAQFVRLFARRGKPP
jgi:hypothetical protein